MRKLTKAQKRALRQCADDAYTRELNSLLGELDSSFTEWRAGQLHPSELSDRIHGFHAVDTRDLRSMYQGLEPSMIVARAIAVGLLKRGDLPEVLEGLLEAEIEFFLESSDRSTIDGA